MLPAKGQLSRLRTALSRHRAALSRLIRMIRMIRVIRGTLSRNGGALSRFAAYLQEQVPYPPARRATSAPVFLGRGSKYEAGAPRCGAAFLGLFWPLAMAQIA